MNQKRWHMGLFNFFKKKENATKQMEPYWKVEQNRINMILQAAGYTDEQSDGASIFQEPQKDSYYNLEDVKTMRMGDYMICPYDAMWYFQAPDSSIIPTLANTEEIRRYLPGLNFETEESCKKTLEACLMKTEAGLGITYVIRNQNYPIGMIMLNSPKYNEKVINLRIWTVDFFITKMFEHKGIMYKSLHKVLNQIKGMDVNYLYATLDKSNTSCKNLLGNGFFTEIDNSHFYNKEAVEEKPLVYRINLSTEL